MSRAPIRPIVLVAALVALIFGLIACGGDDGVVDAPDGEPRERVVIQSADGFNPQQIYQQALPGMVTVIAVLDEDVLIGGQGQGSGFAVSDSEIVTNAHVVTNADGNRPRSRVTEASQVFVQLADRNRVAVEVVGFDLDADVALLEVDADGVELEPLELGDSDEVGVGTPVAAIGSPFGQQNSLSVGIVSATDRAIESLTQFRIEGGIQTDASINPGNSGGPLLDDQGQVIGINQQIATRSGGDQGVGFAVPINVAKRSIEALRADGEVRYAWIGVQSQPLFPQLAERLDVDAPSGALIVEVFPGSPAEEAGLRGSDETITFQGLDFEVGGDVVVSVAGEPLEAENDLARLITSYSPGDEITLEIIRDGETQSIEVTLGERPDEVRDENDDDE